MTGPKRELSLFDSVCVLVGIIVGVGIWETAPGVFAGVPGWGVLAVWLGGGLLSLAGALCYAELASAYPRAGGDVVYFSRAYGPWAGFLFGWSQLVILRPAEIALLCFIFAGAASALWPAFPDVRGYAVAAIVVLTFLNALGVPQGKWTQNVLTVVKIAGVLGVAVAGFLAPGEGPLPAAEFTGGGLELAVILVLFTYGGWNEVGFIAGEMKDPGRTVFRTLFFGMAAVTGLYLLLNSAFLLALGPRAASSGAIAQDTVAAAFPGMAKAATVLVCVSALGSANGMIFTGARISYATGLGGLDRWNRSPRVALGVQALLAIAIVMITGKFLSALTYVTPVVWTFFLLAGAAVLVLRRRDPGTPRPYRVTGYPVTPVVFCACAVYLIYSAVTYALKMEFWGPLVSGGILLLGVPVYLLRRRPAATDGPP